jgi:aryl-alcohol dehydrogenase-like predicted oxidoreductase
MRAVEQRFVGFVPFFPLGGGFLTGKYEQGKPPPWGSRGEDGKHVRHLMTEANYAKILELSAWRKEHGRGMNELASGLADGAAASVLGHYRSQNT